MVAKARFDVGSRTSLLSLSLFGFRGRGRPARGWGRYVAGRYARGFGLGTKMGIRDIPSFNTH